MIGEQLGNYRVTNLLGEGGMGMVFAAEHVLIGRKVAIKVLRPEYSSNPAILERFFNEARAAALIQHPGLIDIFDFGHHPSGSAYLVMEYLEGESLASQITRERTLPPVLVVEIARQAAVALAAAHASGIVHRDLKPDNIFLVPSTELPLGLRVKVIDFGIAKLVGDSVARGRTRTGAVLGTPSYMAPEQCRGAREVDHRADIYSLGCVMFAMACGRPPFLGEGHGDIMAAQIRDIPPIPSMLAPALPRPLEALILRTLAKAPEQRPASMAELGRELESLANRPTAVTPAPFETSTTIVAVPPSTTTLSQAASQRVEEARPAGWRRRIVRGAAVLTTVGGLVGGLLAFSLRAGPSREMADGAHAGEGAGYTSQPARAEASPTVTPLAALPPATAATVTIRLQSQPVGAEVLRVPGEVRLGTTPLHVEAPQGVGTMDLLLRLAGHRDQRIRIDLARDTTSTVRLAPLPSLSQSSLPSAMSSQKTFTAAPRKTTEGTIKQLLTPKLPPAPLPPAEPPAKRVKNGVLDPFGE